MKKQSDELTKFYRAYLAWAEDGAARDNIFNFNTYMGLCSNLEHCYRATDDAAFEMRLQLRAVYGESEYPFGGRAGYNEDSYNDTMHHNGERMAWVRVHAAYPLESE